MDSECAFGAANPVPFGHLVHFVLFGALFSTIWRTRFRDSINTQRVLLFGGRDFC